MSQGWSVKGDEEQQLLGERIAERLRGLIAQGVLRPGEKLPSEPELAARYNIQSIPTLMLFRKGVVVARQAGAMDAQMLRSWLRRYAASVSPAFQAS